jgi:hypothetical protein
MQWAFQGTALKELHIPASVTYFAFSGDCGDMEKINVDPANEHYTALDGVLYDKKLTTLVHVPAGLKIKKLKVPNSVRSVAMRCMGGEPIKIHPDSKRSGDS